MSDKTEQPTAKRLKDAKKQGQFPRSRILSSAAVSVGALIGLSASSEVGAARLARWTESLFIGQNATAAAALSEGLVVLAWMALPALAGAWLASAAASLVTTGFHLNPALVAPKLERISPGQGFKRLFSGRQVVDLLKALLILGAVALVFWGAVSALAAPALQTVRADSHGGFVALLGEAETWAWRGLWLLVAFGLGDFALARRRHLKDLMMTREEVKREHKDSEGDPRHKGQRRAMHRQLAAGGPARGVQKATAIVVNPTHIAVALRYEPSECEAPYLVAKGREQDAFAIRSEAKALGIPVVKDIPLARSLIHFDVGEEIPEELYRAAAAVLKVASESRA